MTRKRKIYVNIDIGFFLAGFYLFMNIYIHSQNPFYVQKKKKTNKQNEEKKNNITVQWNVIRLKRKRKIP